MLVMTLIFFHLYPQVVWTRLSPGRVSGNEECWSSALENHQKMIKTARDNVKCQHLVEKVSLKQSTNEV